MAKRHISFLYPVARHFGFGEPTVERKLENSTNWETRWHKGNTHIQVITDPEGMVVSGTRVVRDPQSMDVADVLNADELVWAWMAGVK